MPRRSPASCSIPRARRARARRPPRDRDRRGPRELPRDRGAADRAAASRPRPSCAARARPRDARAGALLAVLERLDARPALDGARRSSRSARWRRRPKTLAAAVEPLQGTAERLGRISDRLIGGRRGSSRRVPRAVRARQWWAGDEHLLAGPARRASCARLRRRAASHVVRPTRLSPDPRRPPARCSASADSRSANVLIVVTQCRRRTSEDLVGDEAVHVLDHLREADVDLVEQGIHRAAR